MEASTEIFVHLAQFILKYESIFIDFAPYLMIIVGLICCLLLLFISAPYGRYSRPGWGILLNAKFAWIIQEFPAVAIPILLVYFTMERNVVYTVNMLLMSMLLLHYIQRTFLYSLLIQGGKPTPLVPCVLAMMFCTYNGYLQGRYLTAYAQYSDDWLTSPQFIIGCVIFVSGMAINIHSDHILRNLRQPGETGYKIPKGGMFTYVSGANFFGEIVEWTGFAIACWSLPAVAFALFTLFNLGPRALHHHRFYLRKFEDYPKSRKAVLPFIL